MAGSLSEAAAALGEKGGQAKTGVKKIASRLNGKKGGRPTNTGTTTSTTNGAKGRSSD